jgi:hypothetical protein
MEVPEADWDELVHEVRRNSALLDVLLRKLSEQPGAKKRSQKREADWRAEAHEVLLKRDLERDEDILRGKLNLMIQRIPLSGFLCMHLSAEQWGEFRRDIEVLQQDHPNFFWLTMLMAFRHDISRDYHEQFQELAPYKMRQQEPPDNDD